MITSEAFRAVMRNLAGGVTIITASWDGQIFGVTVTSFTSVSIDPILVQMSLAHTSRTFGAVKKSGLFGINLLGADQEWLARRCAEKVDKRWDDVDITNGEHGVPLIAGALGMLECRVTQEVEVGDHTLFVAEVLSGYAQDGVPLIYFQGSYRGFSEADKEDVT